MASQIKTLLLLGILSALMVAIGVLCGGRAGGLFAFALSLVLNIGAYWFSDTIILKTYKAREITTSEAPMLHQIVGELAANAGIPKPRLYLVPEKAPNAFATGRNPEHAAVACTSGILKTLTPREVRAVLAHEIAHVAHRDILIQTIASVLASTIIMMAVWQYKPAKGRGKNRQEQSGSLLLAILAPIAAAILQMAISRSREYYADEGGAAYSRDPLSLASALDKLQAKAGQIPMKRCNEATASLFIVSPVFGGKISRLFSTHPSTEDRISHLQQMAESCRQGISKG